MKLKLTLLATSCALLLSACGDRAVDAPAPTPAAEPAPATAAPTEPAPPAPTEPVAAPADGKPAAVVADCATEIEGNDAMQFNVGSIAVPASCSEFKITLKHTGKLPVNVMGHNVVISKEADLAGVATDGIAAGLQAAHVKAGDTRVIASSSMIGGGETTSVSFSVAKIKDGGPYVFFCSFPGHSALMKGSISVQ